MSASMMKNEITTLETKRGEVLRIINNHRKNYYFIHFFSFEVFCLLLGVVYFCFEIDEDRITRY
jgi:hypothetical protein